MYDVFTILSATMLNAIEFHYMLGVLYYSASLVPCVVVYILQKKHPLIMSVETRTTFTQQL